MPYTIARIPDDQDWKKAYLAAMTTRDGRHFYENMAIALELAGMREHELIDAVKLKPPGSRQFHEMVDELEAINDALYLLKAYFESQADETDVLRKAS